MPTLLKCPQCGHLLEAEPGQWARCSECAYAALVPGDPAPAPENVSPPPSPWPAPAPAGEPTTGNSLLSPFAFLAGLTAVATSYLAGYWFPFLLAAAAIAMGLVAFLTVQRSTQSIAAVALGGVAFLLAIVFALVG